MTGAAGRLRGRRVAVFLDEGFEDLEFWVTVMRLREEGANVSIVATAAGREVRGKNGLRASSDVAASDVRVEELDAVVVPGGWAPDKLRRHAEVLAVVRGAHDAGKIVGLICHAGLVGISAGIVEGSRATGSLGIKDDLVNAGAIWEDSPVVIDRHFVSSRKPDDLPDFCRGILQVLGTK